MRAGLPGIADRRGFVALGVVAILAATLGVYRGLLGLYFTDVDTFALIATGRFASWGDVAAIFGSPLMKGQMPNALFYRPLSSLSWGLDHRLWGMDPRGYHATDLALHLANAWLLFSLMLRVARRGPKSGGGPAAAATALGVALLFAVHPIGMETVPAIARRPDLFFALFLGLTLWVLPLDGQPGGARRVAAALFCGLGLASKDTAIAIPAIAGAFVFCFGTASGAGPRAREALRASGPLLLVTALFVAARSVVLGGLGGYTPGPGGRLDVALHTLEVYGCALLLPGDLDRCPAAPVSVRIGALLVLAASGALLVWRGERRGLAVRGLSFSALSIGILFALQVAVATPAATRTLYVWTLLVAIAFGTAVVQGVLGAGLFARAASSGASSRPSPSSALRVVHALALGVVLASLISVARGAWSGRSLDEWRLAADVARSVLAQSESALATAPAGAIVQLVDFPYSVRRGPLVMRERPVLLEHSVQGWADLVLPEARLEVVGLSFLIAQGDPARIPSSVRFEPEPPRLEIRVGRRGRAVSMPWNNRYGKHTPWHRNEYAPLGARGLSIRLNPHTDARRPRLFLVYSGDRVERRDAGPWRVRAAGSRSPQ